MHALRQIRIGTRLAVAFAAVLLLLALLGGFGMYQMSRANFYANDLGTNWLPSVKVLGDIRSTFNEVRRVSMRHLLENTPEAKAEQVKIYETAVDSTLPKLFAEYEPMIASPEERRAYEEIRHGWTAFLEIEKKQMALATGNDADREAARQLAVGAAAFARFLTLKSRA